MYRLLCQLKAPKIIPGVSFLLIYHHPSLLYLTLNCTILAFISIHNLRLGHWKTFIDLGLRLWVGSVRRRMSDIGTPWVLFMWHPAHSEWDHPRWQWCNWRNMWYIFTVDKSVSPLEQSVFLQLFFSQMTEIQLVVVLVMVDNIFVLVRLYECIRTIRTGV